MRARLDRLWDRLRTSLWFVPGGMTLGAVLLAAATIAVDEVFNLQQHRFLGWIYSGGPEGARALLATSAGSMATVAGVTFSITIVALTMASTQFGPRLLRNFMRDTSNQFVLGTFIATFVYCLLILRTVRGPDHEGFVPQLSVTTGLLLAIASFGVLIYFIHHVSSSIQADSVIAAVAAECGSVIRRLLPECDDGHCEEEEEVSRESVLQRIGDEWAAVTATKSGYVQAIDRDGVLEAATKHDLVIWLKHRPGDFVIEGSELMAIAPMAKVSRELRRDATSWAVIGARRTPIQDVEFSIYQLVEVAARALSPGINDPFTAIACVDRLGAILATLAQRKFPSPYWHDADGVIRVMADESTFRGAVDASFNQIRQYGRTNVALQIRMLETIASLAEFARRPADQEVLLEHAEMIRSASADTVPEGRDRHDIEERFRAVQSAFAREGS